MENKYHNKITTPLKQASPKLPVIHRMIKTSIGDIAVYLNEVENTTPIIFLHGVYFDHNLWNYQRSRIQDRTVITIDMPLHGKSKNVKKDWTLSDCGIMLIEILDSLAIEKVVAVGHSWGSMTILRAASNYPERFQSIGLCNMPFAKGNLATKLKFGLQHTMLFFRGFYTRQVAKVMFTKENREANPEIVEYLKLSMGQLTNKDIRQIDKAVITDADDGLSCTQALKVSVMALKGDKDYVGIPPNIDLTVVSSAHVSPLEVPDKVSNFVTKVMNLK